MIDIKENIKKDAEVVEQAMKVIMPNKEPKSVYSLAWDFIDRGGKRMRPYLLLTCVKAFEADKKLGVEIAAGIEIFHNFTLVHDDIEDSSEMRRGKPCLHIAHGIPLAINAGDGMFAHVFKAVHLSRIPPQKKEKVIGMMADAFISVVEGQGYELEWIQNNRWDIDEKMYVKMAGGKTGALIKACAEIGALIGGANDNELKEMGNFGYEIGLAFQIQDDILNLVGEEEKYKKEIGGDIREGKRTLIVIKALELLDAVQKNELIGILSKKENSEEEIEKAIEMIKSCGAIDYAKKYATKLVYDAKQRLRVVKNDEARQELSLLADLFIKREV